MFMRIKASLSVAVNKNIRQFVSAANFVEEKINIENIDINCVRSGCGENAVLLLPGALGSSWTDFRPQIEQLPRKLPNYTIVAWDPPGYGKSQPPKRQFPVDFFHKDAAWASNLMNKLGFQRFSLLGWSDGGITAIILAAKYPERVDKLVIWGSNAYVLPDELKIYNGIRDVAKWSPKMREPMQDMYGVDGFQRLWSNWIDGFVALSAANNGNICRDEVSQIQARSLIVHGLKDPMIAAEHVPYLRKHIKHNEYYEFPDGKHNIHLRYPDEFNDVVAKFLLKSK